MARLSPLSWRNRELRLRAPLSGLGDLELWPGTAAVMFVLIGSTSFDGFSNGEVWFQLAPSLEADLGHLGVSAIGAFEIVGTVGLIFCVAFVAGLYNLGIYGMRSALRDVAVEDHRALVADVPAHARPDRVRLHARPLLLAARAPRARRSATSISDPLGRGSDLFGTSNFLVNYNLISFAAIWYVQIAAIVTGHVSGLILSHERGLSSSSPPKPPSARSTGCSRSWSASPAWRCGSSRRSPRRRGERRCAMPSVRPPVALRPDRRSALVFHQPQPPTATTGAT